jgi:uncharacterized membrane protein YdfJ with MMPL/SSD domain
VVLGFWIAVFAVAGPLAAKLNSAQENDASAWLPSNAESTQVVELAKKFQPTDTFPAVIVYESRRRRHRGRPGQGLRRHPALRRGRGRQR